jgi:hypothetical protein
MTPRYNCLAWAVSRDAANIWPDPDTAWPVVLPRDESVEGIAAFFQLVGFQDCQNSNFEPGFEKVAIYAREKLVTHVARQLEKGQWTSKLGALADVRHTTLQVLEGGADVAFSFGSVVKVMRRRVTGTPPPLPEMRPRIPTIVRPE